MEPLLTLSVAIVALKTTMISTGVVASLIFSWWRG